MRLPPIAQGILAACLIGHAAALPAQTWNDSTTLRLVERGITARERAAPDSSLTSYRASAHGFVFFLAQAGTSMAGSPRLIKADELDVDVYWKAPGISRQEIRGWRDGRWLPTDIHYHRDHLGIVTNNFGDIIRIGEGDEVRDVVHPLAPRGPDLYDYRLRDSVRLRARDSILELYEVEVVPRDRAAPRIIGTLSLDVATGDLVRFRFSFTPASYLDRSVEDISIVLENARTEGRWWLPWRQEVEIRRRVTWLDFPARSIIRGRWEIGDYALNEAVPTRVTAGPAIGGLRAPAESSAVWAQSLVEAIGEVARPVEQEDLLQVRNEIADLVGSEALGNVARARLGIRSVSDLAHVNRVQGLTLGGGLSLAAGAGVSLRTRAGFGTADKRLTAEIGATHHRPGGGTISLAAGRRLTDLGDLPPISRLVNSLLAQEGGRDHGDYTLLDFGVLEVETRAGPGRRLTMAAGVERSRAVQTEASPAHGRYRPNPPLSAGTIGVARVTLAYRTRTLDQSGATLAGVHLEAGHGDRDYSRVALEVRWQKPLGPGAVAFRVEAGAGSSELPAYRSFALGGWGTLLGEPFRRWGGRRAALAALEYRLEAPFPAIPLGAFVSTGSTMTVAPFLAAGWAGGALPGIPWRPSRQVRPVAGIALEWFHHLLRAEVGVSLRTGAIGVSVDVSRDWWEIL